MHNTQKRFIREAPKWLDEDHWVCLRHYPSAKYPAQVGVCLLGCVGVERPNDSQRPLSEDAQEKIRDTKALESSKKVPQILEEGKPSESPPEEVDVEMLKELIEKTLTKALPQTSLEKVQGFRRKLQSEWSHFDAVRASDLMRKTCDELRLYVGRGLGVVGAGHIKGGKKALIAKVQEVRGEESPLESVQKQVEALLSEIESPISSEGPSGEVSWETLIQVPDGSLEGYALSLLRKYAAHGLGIRGASKIPGGKPVLLNIIKEHRARGGSDS